MSYLFALVADEHVIRHRCGEIGSCHRLSLASYAVGAPSSRLQIAWTLLL